MGHSSHVRINGQHPNNSDGTSLHGRCTGVEGLHGAAGGAADDEPVGSSGKITVVVPAQETAREIVRVEPAAVTERGDQAQCLHAVVGPRAGRDAGVDAGVVGRRRSTLFCDSLDG